MSKRFITRGLISLMLLGAIALAACTNTNAAGTSATGRIKATWITATQTTDGVSVPVSEIQKDTIVHFYLDSPSGKMPFMAYVFGGKTYVRANICPPCRSYNFSIENGILVCDTCGSRFKADTGDGVSGPCVNYPKASVVYEVTNGNVVLKTDALKTAYQNTLSPGLP